MIFVTIGTHPAQFQRLIKKIDEIAPLIKEKIVAQIGNSDYIPKNIEYFRFSSEMDSYYSKARLVICHSATSLIEVILKYKIPAITVPRQKKYGEHINDHQVEFAKYMESKYGVPCIIKIDKLTPQLIKSINKAPELDTKGLNNLRKFVLNTILNFENE